MHTVCRFSLDFWHAFIFKCDRKYLNGTFGFKIQEFNSKSIHTKLLRNLKEKSLTLQSVFDSKGHIPRKLLQYIEKIVIFCVFDE